MKKSAYVRFSTAFFLLFALLSPTAILAMDKDKDKDKNPSAKKRFNDGLKLESAEEWDRAAEEFALAVVAEPKNPEYRLHYQRSLFNASQMYVKKGAMQLSEKDFAGAYLSFRKAYAYDPTNELAKSEMDRAFRLQKGLDEGESADAPPNADGKVSLVQTGYKQTATPQTVVPQRLEKLRDLPFPGGVNLQFIIRELAKDLDLNVLFDEQTFNRGGGQAPDRKVFIELKNVTSARALDYIFLQTGLFFQKIGPRTILVADANTQRQRFQQLVLRTFYLANADPTEVAKVVQFAIPPQQGRTPIQPLVDKPTNSITVRDTTENIRIIGNLIKSLDKDRAEVVMDVQIYEVNKTDLLQLGNQIGTAGSVTNFGGTTRGVVGIGGNDLFGGAAGTAAANIIPRAFGIGLVIPAINLVALQDKKNSKLIASTQIHAFNNEDSQARIGQRVPVRSATISTGFNNNGGANTNGSGFAGDVYTYEQTGLTLKFKPIVFPNQDVQVAMEIESKDVVPGSTDQNPTFTERTVKGTARVQNNKTLLLASVAQNNQSDGRSGLPLLGLIPILGRLFTAPNKNNSQIDIVISVTPRVIRAPSILPEDEIERPTGSLATPTSGSLEAMIVQEEEEEQLAMARRLPTTARVQLPDQKPNALTYTKSTVQTTAANSTTTEVAENSTTTAPAAANVGASAVSETTTQNQTLTGVPNVPFINNFQPIDTKVKTLPIVQTSAAGDNPAVTLDQTVLKVSDAEDAEPKSTAPLADLRIVPTLSEMKAGEKVKVAVMMKSATAFRAAILGMKFDSTKVAVRSVSYGDIFGTAMAQTAATPFMNQNGKMYVSLASSKDAAENSSGVLAYIEIEALADGKPEIALDADAISMTTADGKSFAVKF